MSNLQYLQYLFNKKYIKANECSIILLPKWRMLASYDLLELNMNYGLLDIELTCDGLQQGDKFIDDGRMDKFDREIILLGFISVDEKYKIKTKYSSYVKPIVNPILTDYCKNLTGITQKNVNHGKKCDEAFKEILEIVRKHRIKYIFTFGNLDKQFLYSAARMNRKADEEYENIYRISSKIVDVRPAILAGMGIKSFKRSPGLVKIGEQLGINTRGEHHNALNDAMLLLGVCRKLDIQME